LYPIVAFATTINVPADYATIQVAIDAANNGDTVLVAPGTYVENIEFYGKAITVSSAEGPEVTVIDGNQSGSVVHISAYGYDSGAGWIHHHNRNRYSCYWHGEIRGWNPYA
jgi:regulator of RNase E activity RraA